MLYFIILYLFNSQIFEKSINNCDLYEFKKIIISKKIIVSEKKDIIQKLLNNKCFNIIEYIFDKNILKFEKQDGIESLLFEMKLTDYENDSDYTKLLYKYVELYKDDNKRICSLFENLIDMNFEYKNIFIDEFKTLIKKYNINIEVETTKNKKYNCSLKLLKTAVMKNNELIADLLLKYIKSIPEDFAFFVARNHRMSITMAFILERHKIKIDNSLDNNKNTIMDYLYEEKEDKDIYITILYLKSKEIKKACKVLNKSCIDLSNRLIFASRFMPLLDGATEIFENF